MNMQLPPIPPSFNGFNAANNYSVNLQDQTLNDSIRSHRSSTVRGLLPTEGNNQLLTPTQQNIAQTFLTRHYHELTNTATQGAGAIAYHMANDSLNNVDDTSSVLAQALKTLGLEIDGDPENSRMPRGNEVVSTLAYLDLIDGKTLFNVDPDSDPNAFTPEDLLRLDGIIQSSTLQQVELAYQQLGAGDASAWNALIHEARAFHNMFDAQ